MDIFEIILTVVVTKVLPGLFYIIGEVYRGCSKRRSGWDGRGAYLSGGEGGEGDRDSAKGGSLIDVDMTYERGKEG